MLLLLLSHLSHVQLCAPAGGVLNAPSKRLIILSNY